MKDIKKGIEVKQVGVDYRGGKPRYYEYRVRSTINTVDPKVGDMLTKEEVVFLIDDGIEVRVSE